MTNFVNYKELCLAYTNWLISIGMFTQEDLELTQFSSTHSRHFNDPEFDRSVGLYSPLLSRGYDPDPCQNDDAELPPDAPAGTVATDYRCTERIWPKSGSPRYGSPHGSPQEYDFCWRGFELPIYDEDDPEEIEDWKNLNIYAVL